MAEVFGAVSYTSADAQGIVERGGTYKKKSLIHAVGPIDHDANVKTSEGILTIAAGGFIATDGKQVWPVSAEYMEENYEQVFFTTEEALERAEFEED